MSKIKLYGIIVLVVLFFSMGASIKILVRENKAKKLEIARVKENNLNLMAENRQITNLKLLADEVKGKLAKQVDSLAKQLQIKPKQIEKIITTEIIVHDTLKVPVYVTLTGKNTWSIRDSSKCFVWYGTAKLTQDSLNITRTGYVDHNTITELFYKKRPHKFLGIKFGKWQYEQYLSSTCGGVTKKEIEFLR